MLLTSLDEYNARKEQYVAEKEKKNCDIIFFFKVPKFYRKRRESKYMLKYLT